MHLAEVRLIGCSLGRAGSTATAALAQGLGTCRGLKTLFMVDINMQDSDAVAFAAGVLSSAKQNSPDTGHTTAPSSICVGPLMLETLLLHNNVIGDRGARAVCSELVIARLYS